MPISVFGDQDHIQMIAPPRTQKAEKRNAKAKRGVYYGLMFSCSDAKEPPGAPDSEKESSHQPPCHRFDLFRTG